jgi:uncharacterized protein
MVKIGEYSREDADRLIELARKSIEEQFSEFKPEFPKGKQFMQARGVFVTLTLNGKLRGCIGFPMPIMPVAQAIYESAKSAAFSDPRFSPLKKEELGKIKIEISILTQPVECKPESVKVGRDGLIASYVGYSGLLLPQVATENKMSRLEFLEAVCNKAGLPKDSWQKPGFKLSSFQAEIFGEQ